jgi:acyl-CoA dehydrogenase
MNTTELAQDAAALYDMAQRFAQKEIAPHINEWDEAETFPRALYARAADAGLLGLGYPEDLGGMPAPYRMRNVVSLALSRHCGSGGVLASLFSHNIGLPPCPAPWFGRHCSGGDPAGAARRADRRAGHHRARRRLGRGQPAHHGAAGWRRVGDQRREGVHHLRHARRLDHGGRANGADPLEAKGAGGISMIVVPVTRPACTAPSWTRWAGGAPTPRTCVRQRARAGGVTWWAKPVAGFKIIMGNFNGERLAMSAMALGFAQACYDEALDWARQRKTFGAGAGRAPGDPPQAGGHADAHCVYPGLGRCW